MKTPEHLLPFDDKALFKSVDNPQALLVTRSGRRRRRCPMRFADEHAALDWCLAHRANFVLLTPNAALN